jgi:hypothetical protein
MSRNCKYCERELIDSNYFCNIDCENSFRNENQELYVKYKDDTYDWVCPLISFEETEEQLIANNEEYQYKMNKSEIEKWKIDKCSCFQEFTEMVIKI